MCGVIYFKGDVEEYRSLIISLMKESRVRGLHAFGMAVRSQKETKWMVGRYFNLESAFSLLEGHAGVAEVIGHTRYDTSGDWKVLGNNQPVQAGNNLMVFNGVIRMSLKEEYEKEFKTEYTTANDGEIPLRMFAQKDDDAALRLLGEPGVSFAGLFSIGGRTFALRNPRRPLWYWRSPLATFVVSTRDIWLRATKAADNSGGLIYWDLLEEVPPMEVLWL